MVTKQNTTMEKTPLIKIQQEIEILLSNDFDAMSLTQLKETGKEIGNLFSISRNLFTVFFRNCLSCETRMNVALLFDTHCSSHCVVSMSK